MDEISNEALDPQIIALLFALPRLFALFSMLPMLSRQALPGVLRIGVASCIAMFLVPTLTSQVETEQYTAGVAIAIIMKEACIGFMLGFVSVIPFWAFESMGALIDMQRGASMGEALNPLSGHETSPLGQLYSQASITFLFATGGFASMLAAVYDSYLIWPVFSWWPQLSSEAPHIFLGQLDRIIQLAVLWGAPVICIMFLAEMGLGIVSRFAPQLQVFFLAMPVKSALAIFTLAVYTVTLFDYAQDDMRNIGKSLIQIMHSLIA